MDTKKKISQIIKELQDYEKDSKEETIEEQIKKIRNCLKYLMKFTILYFSNNVNEFIQDELIENYESISGKITTKKTGLFK